MKQNSMHYFNHITAILFFSFHEKKAENKKRNDSDVDTIIITFLCYYLILRFGAVKHLICNTHLTFKVQNRVVLGEFLAFY